MTSDANFKQQETIDAHERIIRSLEMNQEDITWPGLKEFRERAIAAKEGSESDPTDFVNCCDSVEQHYGSHPGYPRKGLQEAMHGPDRGEVDFPTPDEPETVSDGHRAIVALESDQLRPLTEVEQNDREEVIQEYVDRIGSTIQKVIQDRDDPALDRQLSVPEMVLVRFCAELQHEINLMRTVAHTHYPEAIDEKNPTGFVGVVFP